MRNEMFNYLIEPGRTVKTVQITKDESEYHGNIELECILEFDDGSQISYIIDSPWVDHEYLECELMDDKYPRGIYEYKDGKFITIEDWEN